MKENLAHDQCASQAIYSTLHISKLRNIENGQKRFLGCQQYFEQESVIHFEIVRIKLPSFDVLLVRHGGQTDFRWHTFHGG